MYEVVCFKFNGRNRVIRKGLTLEEAQAICRDPETSSQTSTGKIKISGGPWFYGYRKT